MNRLDRLAWLLINLNKEKAVVWIESEFAAAYSQFTSEGTTTLKADLRHLRNLDLVRIRNVQYGEDQAVKVITLTLAGRAAAEADQGTSEAETTGICPSCGSNGSAECLDIGCGVYKHEVGVSGQDE